MDKTKTLKKILQSLFIFFMFNFLWDSLDGITLERIKFYGGPHNTSGFKDWFIGWLFFLTIIAISLVWTNFYTKMWKDKYCRILVYKIILVSYITACIFLILHCSILYEFFLK